MSSFVSYSLQQSQLRNAFSQNVCILCNDTSHLTNNCTCELILEFEINLIQRILLLFNSPHMEDLIWVYLKNMQYVILATFVHSRLQSPIPTDDHMWSVDEYITPIWHFYMDPFMDADDDEKKSIFTALEQRMNHCIENHPNFILQNAVSGLLQLSRSLNIHQQEEDEEAIPTNVIEVENDDIDFSQISFNNQINTIFQFEDERRFNIELLSGDIDELDEILINENSEKDTECPICMENISLDKIVKLQCDKKHLYCSECIVSICYSNPTCSYCRKTIETITTYSDETMDSIAPYLI